MNYIEEAIRSESPITTELEDRLANNARLLHGAIGLCTEVGEFQDALKKNVYYGKDLDLVNLKEELGDVMWYLAILCDELGTTFEEVQEVNIAKLKARYPDKFDFDKALNRDLETEREILSEPSDGRLGRFS